ncbi:hypothetical protein LCGC14_1249640 [marine sediment metagenome]|uniref:Uncharacterized protein n=1 Tax=marine sediment metagenome TaxID=412755 RepID=A0A0F9NKR4_9ZZZZ
MLKIENQKHFDSVKSFAESTGRMKQLQEKLDYLDTYADHENKGLTQCVLGYDFAPYSFSFLMMKKDAAGEYQYWFNGGLIYFSSGDSGVGLPQLSVRIGDTSKSGWDVHT